MSYHWVVLGKFTEESKTPSTEWVTPCLTHLLKYVSPIFRDSSVFLTQNQGPDSRYSCSIHVVLTVIQWQRLIDGILIECFGRLRRASTEGCSALLHMCSELCHVQQAWRWKFTILRLPHPVWVDGWAWVILSSLLEGLSWTEWWF